VYVKQVIVAVMYCPDSKYDVPIHMFTTEKIIASRDRHTHILRFRAYGAGDVLAKWDVIGVFFFFLKKKRDTNSLE